MLFAVWECAPFIKVGGLGDVAHALPKALREMGVDMRVVIPCYKALRSGKQKRQKIGQMVVEYDKKRIRVDVLAIKFLDADIPVYLLRNRKYFDVPQKETWGMFDLAIVKLAQEGILNWKPNIIHCNDHHCGLVPLLVKVRALPVKTLLTIHSLFYQRRVPVSFVVKMGLDPETLTLMAWELKSRRVNYLLEGITHADTVNTVSPAYAKEILTEEYGAGLDDILRKFPDKIIGILNGIDYDFRSPSHSKLAKNYAVESVDKGKAENKKFLQKKLKFTVKQNIPLMGFVGRMEPGQKGVDLLHKMLLRIKLSKYQFVILGEGEQEWEEKFGLLASFYPKNVAYPSDYTDDLAAQIYAASDFILIPSRFEPCCLVQMNAMRYGAIPVARATGGLKDTISDGEDGFLFEKISSHELEKAMLRAVKLYQQKPDKIHEMRQIGMNKDFSWRRSAKRYLEVYQSLRRNA